MFISHVGETVHALFFGDAVVATTGNLVEHFKQAAVEEWDGLVEFFDGSFLVKKPDVPEVALVAVVLVLALIGTGGTKLSFFDRRVECGEEKVLEDGLVVPALLVIVAVGDAPIADEIFESAFGEKVGRDESFLAEKPAEDHPREQADEGFRIPVVSVLCRALRESCMKPRPVEPVANFAEELFVERLNVEGLLPRGVECDEVGEVMFLVKGVEGQVEQDFDVRPVGVGEPDVLDERDFFQHVLRFVALVEAAVDDGERERVAVPKQQHDRHRE